MFRWSAPLPRILPLPDHQLRPALAVLTLTTLSQWCETATWHGIRYESSGGMKIDFFLIIILNSVIVFKIVRLLFVCINFCLPIYSILQIFDQCWYTIRKGYAKSTSYTYWRQSGWYNGADGPELAQCNWVRWPPNHSSALCNCAESTQHDIGLLGQAWNVRKLKQPFIAMKHFFQVVVQIVIPQRNARLPAFGLV